MPANEMKKRIREMIGDNDTGFICTFHGFCVQLLREDIHVINYPESFMILDTEDVETILKTVYENAGIKSKDYTFDMAREAVPICMWFKRRDFSNQARGH